MWYINSCLDILDESSHLEHQHNFHDPYGRQLRMRNSYTRFSSHHEDSCTNKKLSQKTLFNFNNGHNLIRYLFKMLRSCIAVFCFAFHLCYLFSFKFGKL